MISLDFIWDGRSEDIEFARLDLNDATNRKVRTWRKSKGSDDYLRAIRYGEARAACEKAQEVYDAAKRRLKQARLTKREAWEMLRLQQKRKMLRQ